MQTRGNGFESRKLHMDNEANQLRAEVDALHERARQIVAVLRQQKAQLERLATDYGNVSPQLQNVEFMLAAAESMLTEPITAILTSINRADIWKENL